MGTITKAFAILLCTGASAYAFQPNPRTNTPNQVTFEVDDLSVDNRADVQGAVNAAVRGDKVHIPECTDSTADVQHSHRVYKWTGTVSVTGPVTAANPAGGKNIEIYGDGKDVTIINQANNAQRFNWVTENQQPYITARLHDLTIWGEGPGTYFSGNAQLLVDSQGAPILNSAHMGQGGLAVGDIKWECNHALTKNITRNRFEISGYVTGVIYNYEFDDSDANGFLTRPSNENTNIYHNTDRNGTNTNGQMGEYSWTQPWIPGSFDAMYCEDGIEYHSNYGQDSDGGGGREVERYITRWAYTGTHGFRESSARKLPPRITESYNIHTLYNGNDPSAGVPSINACQPFLGNRGGQEIYFNTYATMIGQGAKTNPIPFNYYAVANAQKATFSPSFWDFNADGRNKWDLNQRDQEHLDGSFEWPPSDGSMGGVNPSVDPHTYQVDAAYSHTGNGNEVTNGLPFDSREGFVYFHGTGVDSLGYDASGHINRLNGVTLNGTGLPNPIPQHYLRGFTILKADMDRTTGPSPSVLASNYGLIVNNSAQDASGKINISLGSMWVVGSSVGQVNIGPTDHWEIRKVRDYAINIGAGQGSLRIAPSITGQATLALPAGDTGPNPRWANWTNPGTWQWKNFMRTTNSSGVLQAWTPREGYQIQWLPDPKLNAFEYQPGAYKHMHNAVMPSYPWDPGATPAPTNLKSLVGSHNTNSFVTSNANYASFYPTALGAPTVDYPHPLRAPVANSDPSINGGADVYDTFTVGTQGVHTFYAQGRPHPSFTATGVPGSYLPGFTDNGDGTAVLIGTPSSTAGQPLTITVTATGYLSHTDTQVLHLSVVSPTPNNPPNAPTLTAPASGGQYTTGASIALAATSNGDPDSGDSVASLKFYDGNTLLNTDTSAPYSFTVTSATQGAHSYSAVAVDTHGAVSDNSNIAAVTVADAPVLGVQWQTPTDGQTFPTSPTDIQLLATATGPNGISKIEYYSGSTFLGSVSTPPYTFSWLSVQAGTYPSLIARAYDAVNSSTVDDTISITVQSSSSASPTPAVIQARQ